MYIGTPFSDSGFQDQGGPFVYEFGGLRGIYYFCLNLMGVFPCAPGIPRPSRYRAIPTGACIGKEGRAGFFHTV